MWVSEVKTKKGRYLGSFNHRKSFATMDEGLDWARNLAMQILENSFYKDEELIMHHYEDKNG
jgi:hypothetical protein